MRISEKFTNYFYNCSVLAALVIGWAAVLTFAQTTGSVAGRVLDPDARAVAGASLVLYSRESGGRLSTTSDGEGEYHFAGLAAGDYLLQVTAEGFAGSNTQAVRVAPGRQVKRDITLKLARLQTSVVVTASSTPLMLEEVAKAADVVTAEEMSLRDAHSVAEALRLEPGFCVRQRGGPGSLTAVRIRGLRSYDTALLVDGLRMRDAADPQGSANPLWEDLLVLAPERVEVLRGSGSSLYGSHAIGGVVNVVSEPGGGRTHGELTAEGGGLGLLRGLGKASGGALGNRLLYSGGFTHLNVTRGLDDVNPYRNTSGQGFLKYKLTPRISWSGRLLAGTAFLQAPDSPYVAPELEANYPAAGVVPARPLPDEQVRLIEQGLPYQAGAATYVPSLNDPDSRRSFSFYNLATIFSHRVNRAVSYRASYQFLDTNRRHQDGPAGQRWEPAFSTNSTFDGRVHLAQGRADIQGGANQLFSGGYEFEQEEYDSLNTDENPVAAARAHNRVTLGQRSHSAFLQDQVSLLGRALRIAVSGRVQAFRLQEPKFLGGGSPYAGIPVESPKTAWTGDAAVSYLLRATGTKWRAHAGNAYRAPSAFERFGASFFFGMFSPFGDPRLRPERAISFDGGLDQWFANTTVKVSATYFYTALRDAIIFDFSGLIPPDDPFHRFGGYLNFGRARSRGLEVSLRANPAPGTVLEGAYTYVNSDQGQPWDAARQLRQTPGISANSFSLLVSQWFGKRFNVTFDLFAAGDYLTLFGTMGGPRALEMNGPVLADLVARYAVPVGELRQVEFYGKLQNLLNRNLYEEGYRTPGIQVLGGLRLVF